MMPAPISRRIVLDRLAWVSRMVAEIRTLPLEREADFLADGHNAYVAESCLRRALEALLDIGRHVLAKQQGQGVSEYKEIARQLGEYGILSPENARRLRIMAGYRNRLVHFYHEITERELFEICSTQLDDVVAVAEGYRGWFAAHPEMLDETL